MSAPLLPDDLWDLIQPLLPAEPPKPKGGRSRVPDRRALTGILFVLKTGCPWQALPCELDCGSGSTCWRRLRERPRAGVWERLHQLLLDCLGSRGRIDWSHAALDSASIPAKGGEQTGPNPTDRGWPGTNTTCWWTGTASRWRRATVRRTGTTRGCSSRRSTGCGPSRDCGAVPASARTSSTATRATALTAVGTLAAGGASRRA